MSGICPEHGPYDGNTCPYHGNARRPVNPSLAGDELTTNFDDSGNEPTELPGKRKGNHMIDDGEETTDYGQGNDDLDMTELEAPSTATLAMLWVKEGRRRGHTYNIKNGMVVGRKDTGLILDDPKVSSMHAKFKMEGNDFVVWDLGSSNGTYVNGKKIRGATILDENDLVKIGDTIFVVKLLIPRPKRKVVNATAKSKKSVAKKPSKK